MRRVPVAERRARLGHLHHLAAPAADVVTVAGDLAGLHSSDPAAVYLAARARVTGLTRDDLARALYQDRSLLRILAMRRTMFVVPPGLAAVMLRACTLPLAVGERKRLLGWLADQEIGDEAWLDALGDEVVAVLDDGPLTAMELREIVPELQTQLEIGGGTVGVSTRVLFLLATEGRLVRGRPRGTWVSSQYRWARFDRWVDGSLLIPEDEAAAAAEVIGAWLGAFGPATETDAAWWSGWGKRKTRAALAAAGAVEVALDDGVGYLHPDRADPIEDPAPWVAFLPGLDPTTMGWKERDWYLGGHAAALFDRNGNAGPTLWADGRVVGGWAHRNGGEVAFELLEDVGAETRVAIEAEAGRLEEWIGGVVYRARFPTPLEKRLRA
jgi:hypothetical protein